MVIPLASSSNLIARLKLDEQSSDSLIQLQPCTREIISFSLMCWSNMIDILGITIEEGYILEGYYIKDEDDGNWGNYRRSVP
ncbi:hypothetical protein P3X46_002591 [Hevea brasiliensis]|uniref:Uncharacterized protein n=1 Tax=Hevea brasiliensis TaxID=3981 RepID=A0ABQ9N584_HEVBR|nr:hypothetical protein P3X46_002591 [Hevea brasiliensis]